MKAEDSYFAHAEFPHSFADIDTSETTVPDRLALGTMSKTSIVMVWLWALFETRWELAGETEVLPVAALLVAKLILTVIVIWTLRRAHLALAVFSFCCAVSIIVIAMALPRMYSLSPWFFCLSLVETVLKTAALASLAFDYFRPDSTVEEAEPPWRMR
ncbi:hypothetical protein AB4Y40_07275 [Paraburkholderia sp. EG287B]|uniref:hypothetical protein n=1 Tax=Paraburkholderia sp. EG287B TaxID=3237010 RepID=UPI0034D1BF2A